MKRNLTHRDKYNLLWVTIKQQGGLMDAQQSKELRHLSELLGESLTIIKHDLATGEQETYEYRPATKKI